MPESEFAVDQPVRRRLPGPNEWQSALEQSLAEAEKRGDFNNLPGHGKPIQFEANPLTGEIDLGMGLLKSAGFAPGWIEIEKEIRAKTDDLVTTRERDAAYLATLSASPDVTQPPQQRRQSWWRTLLFGSRAYQAAPTETIPVNRATAYERALNRYLEQAREVDRLITSYNSSLPRELWHLERPRLTQDEARRDFESAVQSAMLPLGTSSVGK